MRIFIDSPEVAKNIYEGYNGRVLEVQTHIGALVNGGGVGGNVFLTSSTVEVKKARVALKNGRIKEINVNDVEVQEGDEIEFVTAGDGMTIYVKNLTTGVSNMVDLYYEGSVALNFFAIALVGIIIYGLINIFSGKTFLMGLFCVAGGVAMFFVMGLVRQFWVRNLESDFHKKIRATGIDVPVFKPAKQEAA